MSGICPTLHFKIEKSAKTVTTQSKQLRDPLLCLDPSLEKGSFKPVSVLRPWLSRL